VRRLRALKRRLGRRARRVFLALCLFPRQLRAESPLTWSGHRHRRCAAGRAKKNAPAGRNIYTKIAAQNAQYFC